MTCNKRNITAYGRRRCHRQSVMAGFITIRSILPAMTLLMTKWTGHECLNARAT
ncbi:hypothetical protein ACNKHR_13070 [Shigella flexneri]